MDKYISIEKLKAEIEKRIEEAQSIYKSSLNPFWAGQLSTFQSCLNIINSLQQKQPKVDLEKFTEKVNTFQERYKHPEIISIKGAMAFMARMFYQYPNVARQWYEQLPRATMN